MNTNIMSPLKGIRVIDMSRVLAGPLCGQMLADMGADVIKVEGPGGDENRKWGPFNKEQESCNYLSVNRGKRCIALDLKSDKAREILYGLLSSADILISSFLPKTAQGLGVGSDYLRKRFPRLIIVNISAFGHKGELADSPGYDTLAQAFSGIMSITGEASGMGVRAGVSFVDLTTGVFAYSGALTALEHRRQIGSGTVVRVSLLETAISMLGYHAVGWLEAGALPIKQGSGIWHLVPYQSFKCADGEILTGALNDHTWLNLCQALSLHDFAQSDELRSNEGRVRNRDLVVQRFQDLFSTASVNHWVQLLEEYKVPVTIVNTIDKSLAHPQVLANEMVVELKKDDGASLRLLRTAFTLDDAACLSNMAPPTLGQHSDAILKDELQLSNSDIASLRREGVVR